MNTIKSHFKLQTIFSKISLLFLISAIIYFLSLFYIVFPKIDDTMIRSQKEYVKLELDKINDLILMFSNQMEEKKKDHKNAQEISNFEKEQIQKFKNYVQQRKIGLNGYFLIIEDDVNYIHPNKKYNKKTTSYFKKYNGVDTLPLLKKSVKENKPFEFLFTKGEDYETLHKKLAWVKYNSYLDWYILATIYTDDLYSEPNEIKQIILNISLVIMLILYCLFLISVKKIVKPLRNLTYNIKGFKKKNNKEYPIIFTNDEIGLLSKEFNLMKEKINSNINDLEETIKDRTKEIQNRLYFDEITGLKNRNSLITDIKRKDKISMILIDINKFNEINILYGYNTGNHILREFTKFLEEFAFTHGYELYRLEGVTFAFIKTNESDIERYHSDTTNFLKDLNLFAIYLPEIGDNFYLNATLGISINEERPLKTAYSALNKAKREGISVFIYNDYINDKALIENNIFWSKKIKQAILDQDIVPFYQPIVDEKGNILKYEVLMRLYDKQSQSYTSPFYFLDISKKTKQYAELSSMIVAKSLKYLEQSDVKLSINLNYTDIINPSINAILDTKLTNKEIGKRLTIEILEDMDIQDYDKLFNFIKKYRAKGVSFAIDDFGTGYSNFKNILNIRPDFIKIDGSLIKNIHEDEVSYKLVKSIVKFSEEMGIEVIAEFVHSEEVFEKLKELQIFAFQGYYFGKPSQI